MRIGALEAGGTKMVCAVVEDGQVVDRISMPTRSPAVTVKERPSSMFFPSSKDLTRERTETSIICFLPFYFSGSIFSTAHCSTSLAMGPAVLRP